MKLFDKLAKKFALRWFKGKVDRARKEGNSMGGKTLRVLDGQKRTVFVIAWIVVQLITMATGQDFSHLIGSAALALGWTDAELLDFAKATATIFVPLLWGAWAAAHALFKGWKEWKAGATLSEVGSTTGAVKAAVAQGDLQIVANSNATPTPVMLEVKGQPVMSAVA